MTRLLRGSPVGFLVLAGALSACREVPTAETVQLAVVAGSEHGGKPFHEPMTQEVTTQPVYSGDPDGTGSALITINAGQGEVCWELVVEDIQLPASASHIHNAGVGVRGGIVVALSPPDALGQSSGCRTGVDRDLLRDILDHPEAYYVNVHTAAYPQSAIRGQLGPE